MSIIEEPTKKSNKKNITIIGSAIAVIIAIIGIFIWNQHNRNYNYDTLPQIETPNDALKNIKNDSKINGLTFEYYHRPGCKHCELMAKKGIVKNLRQTKNLKVVDVTAFIEANKTESNNWFNTNYVINTPTLIVRYHGYAIYTYAGSNLNTFKKLLKGINPDTNKAFNKTNYHINTIKNDFSNTKSSIEAYKPDNLVGVKTK